MTPMMQETLEKKRLRRARLMALSYPEKVRIVEQMRDAALRIKAVTLRENIRRISRIDPRNSSTMG